MSETETVAAYLATRKAFNDSLARIIAAWWHSGQSSALYSFASCGNVTKAAIDEVLTCIEDNFSTCPPDCPLDHEGELEALRKLLAYLRSHRSQKGPQEDWDARTSY